MINKKFVAIVLAIGLFMSIGFAVSQPRAVALEKLKQSTNATKPTNDTESTTGAGSAAKGESGYIDAYDIYHYSPTMITAEAVIECYSAGVNVASVRFQKDDETIRQNSVDSYGKVDLYYPYSRYNDVLAIIAKGKAKVYGDSKHPENSCIIFSTGH